MKELLSYGLNSTCVICCESRHLQGIKAICLNIFGNETESVKQGASSHKLLNFPELHPRGMSHFSILKFNRFSECISRFHHFWNCALLWVIYNLLLLSISRISLTFLLCCGLFYPTDVLLLHMLTFQQPVFFQLQDILVSKEAIQKTGKEVFILGSSNLKTFVIFSV